MRRPGQAGFRQPAPFFWRYRLPSAVLRRKGHRDRRVPLRSPPCRWRLACHRSATGERPGLLAPARALRCRTGICFSGRCWKPWDERQVTAFHRMPWIGGCSPPAMYSQSVCRRWSTCAVQCPFATRQAARMGRTWAVPEMTRWPAHVHAGLIRGDRMPARLLSVFSRLPRTHPAR